MTVVGHERLDDRAHATRGTARRRRTDGALIAVGRQLANAAEHPAGLGRTVLLGTGLIAVLTAPALDLSERAWLALAGVSAGMLTLTFATVHVDWKSRSARALLVFPAAVLTALLSLGLAQPVAFAPLTGLLIFVFVYLGLTQPAGTSSKAAPVAAGVYLAVNGQLVASILVRLLVAALVWVFLGELLAQMTARRHTLTNALQRAANRDPLTGADTRRVWDERLRQTHPGTTVVICDLDHFKAINDTHGHLYGDRVLADFGAMLLTALRPVDCIARYGGEEFALLLTDAPIDDATTVLARLHRAWAALRPGITFSAGLAVCHDQRDNLDTFNAADTALYRAKHEGRNSDRIAA